MTNRTTTSASDKAPKAGLEDYNVSVSEDRCGLRYPGYSVVFMQLFVIDKEKRFVKPENSPAGHFIKEISKSIDKQIFNIKERKGKEDNLDMKSIRRFTLKGFHFSLPLDTPYPVVLTGNVFVEMSLLFGHTVSVTYRFLFDGSKEACSIFKPNTNEHIAVTTDHIIGLLSTHLSAEFWGKNEGCEETSIDYDIKDFKISDLCLDENGNVMEKALPEMVIDGEGRLFDKISSRYRKYIKRCCCVVRDELTYEESRAYRRLKRDNEYNTFDDFHYAMVDLWENVQHPVSDSNNEVTDIFSKDLPKKQRMSEAEITEHIRDYHKPELIGLMTLYPGEWPYRDASAFDEVCGENIAIDTDDLVLVNHNLCVVLGLYGRRGSEAAEEENAVNWKEHLEERSKYHVSWPEYLLILEMVLAKKYVIAYANDQLIEATLGARTMSSSSLIERNAELSMRLSRMELQLDVVKYSKFMSHKIMFDRTVKRLEMDYDVTRLNDMMSIVDNSLHNISDFKAMKSDYLLNFILAIISVASTFELFFQNAEMPFLEFFGLETSRFAAVVVAIMASITIFGILLVLVNTIRNIIDGIKDNNQRV